MSREETIKLLNKNITKFDISSANRFIVEYLTEKQIKSDRILLFLNHIQSDVILRMNNTYLACLEYSIKHFINKHNINSISKDNKTLYYF